MYAILASLTSGWWCKIFYQLTSPNHHAKFEVSGFSLFNLSLFIKNCLQNAGSFRLDLWPRGHIVKAVHLQIILRVLYSVALELFNITYFEVQAPVSMTFDPSIRHRFPLWPLTQCFQKSLFNMHILPTKHKVSLRLKLLIRSHLVYILTNLHE